MVAAHPSPRGRESVTERRAESRVARLAGAGTLTLIRPESIRIAGCEAVRRVIHQDARGFLVETLRADDVQIDGARFVMSYTSVTAPGEFRDRDRWHVHKRQTDRFVVPLGEMLLALFDAREYSTSTGELALVRMSGVPIGTVTHQPSRDQITFLVPIPPGVYHCIGNVSDTPFVLQNFPTGFYDPEDEGRVPFGACEIPSIRGPFSWESAARAKVAPP